MDLLILTNKIKKGFEICSHQYDLNEYIISIKSPSNSVYIVLIEPVFKSLKSTKDCPEIDLQNVKKEIIA